MKGIVGVLKPMAGSCRLADDVRIAYLPQQSELDRSFPARVVDIVSHHVADLLRPVWLLEQVAADRCSRNVR